MGELVITIASDTRGLQFMFGLRHQNYPGFMGQNCFHKSLTSMLDEYIDVWMGELVITLPSDTRGFWLKSMFTYHNNPSLNHHNWFGCGN